MTVHIAELLRVVLAGQPLGLSELRRKLPTYAQAQAETVLLEEIAQGRLHRHPRSSGRGGERFGRHRPDPREYLRGELSGVFQRLEGLGFSEHQVREAAIELLHDEEWAPTETR